MVADSYSVKQTQRSTSKHISFSTTANILHCARLSAFEPGSLPNTSSNHELFWETQSLMRSITLHYRAASFPT